MINTPDSPAQMLDDRMILGGNFWTLFTPGIWKLLHAVLHVLGLDRVYVQAKRHAPGSTIGRPEIQAFTGSLVGLGASKGVFVTTSAFSAMAIEFASRIPQRVVLINGKRLIELMVEHGVGVRISRTVDFKRLDEDFFSEE